MAGFKIKIPKPRIPKPSKPHKPHIPNPGTEVRGLIEEALAPLHEELDALRSDMPDAAAWTDSLTETFDELEAHLEEEFNQLQMHFVEGIFDLTHLIESGLLGELFEKFLDMLIDATAGEPVRLETPYFDFEIEDIGKAIKAIRDAVDHLPSNRTAWRKLIIAMSPRAVRPKIGIPILGQAMQWVPFADLEEAALDALLRKVGL